MNKLTIKQQRAHDLFSRAWRWAEQRDLHTQYPGRQFFKLIEELGELASAAQKADRDGVDDAIGDIFVVLLVFQRQIMADDQRHHCLNWMAEAWFDAAKSADAKMVLIDQGLKGIDPMRADEILACNSILAMANELTAPYMGEVDSGTRLKTSFMAIQVLSRRFSDDDALTLLEKALKVIERRTGSIINGTFVKDVVSTNN